MPDVPRYAWDGEDCFGCPFEKVNYPCLSYVRLFGHYKAGYLWNEGGLADQPHVYLRIMEIVNVEVSKIEHENFENQKKDMESKTRGSTESDPRQDVFR